MRWSVHAAATSYVFNDGWPRIRRGGPIPAPPAALPALSELPAHALRAGKSGPVGKRIVTVVNARDTRRNPLSQSEDSLIFNRGKGCGTTVAAEDVFVMRAGTLAFYDTKDDSGMRFFGGIRNGCGISAMPAQGVIFSAEASSGCDCNYNFKCSLALAPAQQRRHEDWALFMAPLSPGAMLHTGRFNLGAPGDRRDDDGALWLQYPRAPTYAKQNMPVPVDISGEALTPYRVNADRVAIANTDKPWVFASGYEGLSGVRVNLFMSDKEGAVVFPAGAPALDATLDDRVWNRHYPTPAGKGGTLYLSHDATALYLGFELAPQTNRRGERIPWKRVSAADIGADDLLDDPLAEEVAPPYTMTFAEDDAADDTAVWQEDSIEFLLTDQSLARILHFGVGISRGRYDGKWEGAAEDAAYSARWSGAVRVTADQAVFEAAIPWQTIADAGLDRDTLFIRPRTKKPLTRKPHISHGFRPVILKTDRPRTKAYRVSLHFAELLGATPGDRVFDVRLQGQTVKAAFDPVAAAGGPQQAVSLTFPDVAADSALDIEFIKRGQGPNSRPPILSALEVVLQKRR
jgi:hypothetical protein